MRGQESNINYRRIPWLNDLLKGMERRIQRQVEAISTMATANTNRKYRIASGRMTAILALGGSTTKTITWSGPFDDLNYSVEFALCDLEGVGTVTEQSRTTTTLTVQLTAGLAAIPIGAVFMALGRSSG